MSFLIFVTFLSLYNSQLSNFMSIAKIFILFFVLLFIFNRVFKKYFPKKPFAPDIKNFFQNIFL